MPVEAYRVILNPSTSTLLAAAPDIASATMYLASPDIVYIGAEDVTALTGLPIGNGDLFIAVPLGAGEAVFGISAPGRSTVVAVMVT